MTTQTILSFDSYSTDLEFIQENTMIDINFFSSNKEYTYIRVYYKIQSVMADIMALFASIQFAVGLMCYIFSLSKRNTILMNKIYEFDLEEIEPKKSSRKFGNILMMSKGNTFINRNPNKNKYKNKEFCLY